MRKQFLIGLIAIVASTAAAAQVADGSGTRDFSRYADDRFKDGETYTVVDPYEPVSVSQPRSKRIRNVIVMIGDGMGLEQISTAWVLNGGCLNLDNFLFTGFSRTYATDKLITDSCAGGAALSTGVKTRYGYIGCTPEGEPALTAMELARQVGMKTGIICTCRINDATPADFCLHSTSRKDEEGIAAQYVDCGVDFLVGGGSKFWKNRPDGRDLIAEMVAKGYEFAGSTEELEAATGDRILSLLDGTEMAPALDRGPILEKATMKALSVLSGTRKGFCLMVEGSRIDDHCHHQKLGMAMEELFDFDRTIGRVLEWAEADGHTLVIVTADHATGGMTLLGGSIENHEAKVNFSTKGHNGILVPVFAYGPGAEKFVGVHENCEIGQLIQGIIAK